MNYHGDDFMSYFAGFSCGVWLQDDQYKHAATFIHAALSNAPFTKVPRARFSL